jgi:hypothetical protein
LFPAAKIEEFACDGGRETFSFDDVHLVSSRSGLPDAFISFLDSLDLLFHAQNIITVLPKGKVLPRF